MLAKKKNVAGFTLLELMVTVAIIGVMATLAIPRMNAYIARARTAEARTGLDQIYKLQQSWRYENETFNDGAASAGAAETAWNTEATAYGYRAALTWDCMPNRLGFRVAECHGTGTQGTVVSAADAAAAAAAGAPPGRYMFFIDASAVDTFTAVAVGAAYNDSHRIFPGCSAGQYNTAITLPATSTVRGDVWSIDEQRNLSHDMSATELCATD